MNRPRDKTCENEGGGKMVWRLVKVVVVVAVLAGIGLSVFAYLGDLSPVPSEESLTVTLDAN